MKKKEYGFLRPVDTLGRLVIPCDLREQYGFAPNEKVLLVPQKDGVMIKPYKEDKQEP